MNECAVCGAEVRDAYGCVDCLLDLRDAIKRAGVTTDNDDGTTDLCLLDELDLAISRQSRSGERVGGRSAERPLPFNTAASEAHSLLAHTLSRAALVYGMATGSGAPRRAARYLLGLNVGLGQRLDIIWFHKALAIAISQADLAIDAPPARSYVGICSAPKANLTYCHVELYAVEGQGVVTCPSCKAQHDVGDRRAVLMRAVEEVLATATDIARAVHLFNEPIKPALIHTWKARGKLHPGGTNAQGQPLYRVGDVLSLAAQNARDSGLHIDSLTGSM